MVSWPNGIQDSAIRDLERSSFQFDSLGYTAMNVIANFPDLYFDRFGRIKTATPFKLYEYSSSYPHDFVNLIQECGYFDDSNGIFWRKNNNKFSIVVRSNTSGSVVAEDLVYLGTKQAVSDQMFRNVLSDIYLGRDIEGNADALVIELLAEAAGRGILFSGQYREFA